MPVTSEAFKALGDRNRLAIFEILLEGPHHVSTLVKRLGLSQPHVSKQLRILKDAGLVQDHRHGKWVEYRLSSAEGSVPNLILMWAESLGQHLSRPMPWADAPLRTMPAVQADGAVPAAAGPMPTHIVVRKPDDAFDSYLL
jgi:ArsR family transcriptional regulator